MKTIFKAAAVLATGFLISGSVLANGGLDHASVAGHLVFKQNTLHIHATFSGAPMVNEEALLVLEAKDPKTHQTIELNDNIEVVLWMPSMGHGSGPTHVERAVDAQGNIVPGTFNVRNIYFIMGGEWEVRVILTDVTGYKETKAFKVTLEGGHGGHH